MKNYIIVAVIISVVYLIYLFRDYILWFLDALKVTHSNQKGIKDIQKQGMNKRNLSNQAIEKYMDESKKYLDRLEIDVGKEFELINLYGGWGFEGQKNKVTLQKGMYITDSKTGNSSNRHNPFFLLKAKDTTYNTGDAYSFNLRYSGNHYEMIEVSSFNKIRIQTGINPYCFKYELK